MSNLSKVRNSQTGNCQLRKAVPRATRPATRRPRPRGMRTWATECPPAAPRLRDRVEKMAEPAPRARAAQTESGAQPCDMLASRQSRHRRHARTSLRTKPADCSGRLFVEASWGASRRGQGQGMMRSPFAGLSDGSALQMPVRVQVSTTFTIADKPDAKSPKITLRDQKASSRLRRRTSHSNVSPKLRRLNQ